MLSILIQMVILECLDDAWVWVQEYFQLENKSDKRVENNVEKTKNYSLLHNDLGSMD